MNKILKTIAAALAVLAVVITFSRAEDSVLWIQFLAAAYLVGYALIRFRGEAQYE